MGEKKLIDKTISPAEVLNALMAGSITVAQAQAMYEGVMVIGGYKGIAAILDLNLLVNEPLVQAEPMYILGILNGREEGYDLRTITIPITAVVGTALSGTLVVPATELWYVNAIQAFVPNDVTAGVTTNWHCNLWTDRAAVPSTNGQPFRTAAQALLQANCPPGGPDMTLPDEFGPIATAWAVTNMVPLLRLPAATVLTFTILTDTALPTAAIAVTFSVHGAVAKKLVD